jgi:L-threonine kinase
VEIQSDLPAGKGMASSSADIAAACMATAVCLGLTLTADEIATIALGIEPTDGVFYQGIMMLDHVKGSIRRTLGMPPPLRIAVLDMGGEVDTVGFNQREDLNRLNRAKESEVIRALQMVEDGIRRQDAAMIGAGATLSALANQKILHKPLLENMLHYSQNYGAVGVNVAHSGTVVGILFPEDKADAAESCMAEIYARHPDLPDGKVVSLLPGGLTVLEGF